MKIRRLDASAVSYTRPEDAPDKTGVLTKFVNATLAPSATSYRPASTVATGAVNLAAGGALVAAGMSIGPLCPPAAAVLLSLGGIFMWWGMRGSIATAAAYSMV